MSQRDDLKLLCENSVGFGDVSLAPDVVLGLLAELDVSNSVGSALGETLESVCESRDALARAVEQLKAENEELRKERDARHPFKPFHEPAIGFTGCVICGVYTDHGGLPCPKMRATADAAMGKGEQA